MILPRSEDALHKLQMFRLLVAILGDTNLSKHLVFKGGTCAVLRGWLDRFSVDLDFDLDEVGLKKQMRERIHALVKDLGFEMKDESANHLQFFLKYKAVGLQRNTLKLEINDLMSQCSESEIANLRELNMLARTQTQGTMMAHKLIAAMGRYKDHGSIAGRDFYDLRHFLSHGFDINTQLVEERTGVNFTTYIDNLIRFIEEKVTDEMLFEDLNPLLPGLGLKKVIKNLRQELLWLLRGLLVQE